MVFSLLLATVFIVNKFLVPSVPMFVTTVFREQGCTLYNVFLYGPNSCSLSDKIYWLNHVGNGKWTKCWESLTLSCVHLSRCGVCFSGCAPISVVYL